jgi:hypothetical protein
MKINFYKIKGIGFFTILLFFKIGLELLFCNDLKNLDNFIIFILKI